MEKSERSFAVTALLAFFLGSLGVHRFYAGKIGSGIAQLLLLIVGSLTAILVIGLFMLFGLGIWVLVDFIMILIGNFKDGEGRLIKN